MRQTPARHHQILLRHLEKVAAGEIDRLMVLMPPGSAKSTYCSHLFPAWFLAQRPNLDLIGASHGDELAKDFSGRVQDLIRHNARILGYALRTENVAAWKTTNGGNYRAAGVGGSITGRRSDLTIIDDPIKGAVDAESQTVRDTAWNWYQSEVYTRLKPGSRIVLIQCMTGDTQVRLADSSERRLDAIRPGDAVATYEAGRLASARVLGWKAQGEDAVFELRTQGGAVVKANERHPFLVVRSGKLVWSRLGRIRPGDQIVRQAWAETNRGNGESGGGLNAPSLIATFRQSVKRVARFTMIARAGRQGTVHRPTTSLPDVSDTFGIGTGLNQRSSLRYSLPKTGDARFAESPRVNRTSEHIGNTASASTITTRRMPSADSSVTTATLWSDTAKTTPPACGLRPNTSKRTPDFALDEVASITPAGHEIVYDVQIERTENFIANGLVSHNTRWHPDDLGGRLLTAAQAGGDQWTVLKLPALCDSPSDPLGRPLGAALWPEWQDEAALARIRTNVGEYVWGALYQQDPKPRGASFFDVDDLLVDGVPVPMPDRCDTVFAVLDTAIKSGQHHNSTAVTYFAYNSLTKPTTTLVLDWEIVQIEGAKQAEWLPSVFARLEELARFCGARRGSAGVMIEDKATGTVLLQQAENLRREGKHSPAYAIDSKLTAMGKDERAIAAAPYVIAGGIKVTEPAWNKTTVHKGRSANHLILQVSEFRLARKGDPADDLLDTLMYGISITHGTASGDRKGI